ncbi:MAG: tetratricopeptide repeat protein, partial [Sedimentisphaerales bacterium]|nr:tetratricopeptide repeat protein [Sedimentisphaerales bacterium]
LCGPAGECRADESAQTVIAKEPNPAGLVAHYEFEGNANDSAGNNHGIEFGSPVYGNGVSGQAISFNGEDDYIVITDNDGQSPIEFGKGSFSIAFWLKSDFVGISNSRIKEFIICNGTDGTEFDAGGYGPDGRASGKRYVIKFQDDDFRFVVDDDSRKTILEGFSDDFATGDWVHVVAVRNTGTRELLLYRDNIFENSVTCITVKSIASPGEPLFIGAKQREKAHADDSAGAPMDYHFKGMLDDLRIYNYALSEAEVAGMIGANKIYTSSPLAEIVFEKARRYDRSRQYEDAKYYYQQVIQRFPESLEADRAPLDIRKVEILSMFKPAEVDSVLKEIDRLIGDFSEHPYLPEALFSIAERCKHARKPEWAKDLYKTIITDYPDTDYALESLKALTILSIDSANSIEAEQVLEKLNQRFSGRADLADALYEIAEAYERSGGGYEKAQTLYQQINQQFPDIQHPGLSLGLSRTNVISLIEKGDFEKAQQDTDKLVAEFSANTDLPKTLCDIAEKYEQAGQYGQATTIYKQVAADYPGTDEALTAQKKLAIIDIEQGDDTAALAELDKLIADFRNHQNLPDAVFEIAEQFYEQGCEAETQQLRAETFEIARNIYNRILTDYANTDRAIEAQKKLAIIFYKEDNDTAALAELDKLIADFRYHYDLFQTIFEIAEEFQDNNAKKYERVRTIYNKVMTDYPGTDLAFKALEKLAIINVKESNEVEAMAALDKLIVDFNDHPDSPGAMLRIGEQYCYQAFTDKNQSPDGQINRFHKAIALWDKIITQFPDSEAAPQAHYYSGVSYRRLGEYAKAIEHFQKAADDWPDDWYSAKALFRVGNCYEELINKGDLPESEANPIIEQAYQAVIERYPDNKYAAYATLRLGLFNFDKGHWAKAATYFELYLQKFPQDLGNIVLFLGKAYEKMDELNLAIETYRAFTEMAEPNDRRIEGIKSKIKKLEDKLKES